MEMRIILIYIFLLFRLVNLYALVFETLLKQDICKQLHGMLLDENRVLTFRSNNQKVIVCKSG